MLQQTASTAPRGPHFGLASSVSMDASRKRAHMGSCSAAEDHLSALPDALIHAIMSFLKAPQVVQTSVLAKRWRHLWRSVPYIDIDQLDFNNKTDIEGRYIDIDQLDFNNKTDIEGRYEKFVDFTDYLLFHRHHDGSLLDTFKLHVSEAQRANTADAGRWVRRIVKLSPRVLCIQFDCSYPQSVIPLELCSSSCRLTKLHLLGLLLDCSFAEQISSVCNVLVELQIKNCRINFQKITSSSLKNLIIKGRHHFYGHHDRDPRNQLIITAPRLAYLHLNLKARHDFLVSVNEMLSLVKASMSVQVDYPHEAVHDNQCKLLSSLFNVTNLELMGFHIMVVPDEELIELPIFNNLTNLLLDKCDLGEKFQLLRHFLENSPNLETLIVQYCQFSGGSKKGKGKARSKKSQRHEAVYFGCPKLKYTEIIYKGDDNIRPLFNVLLDISDHLPKNTITLTKLGSTRPFVEEEYASE